MNSRWLKKQLKKDICILRKSAKKTKLNTNHKAVKQILRENLHLLEREGIYTLREMRVTQKKFGKQASSSMVTLCEDAVLHMRHSINESILTQLQNQNRWFSTHELVSVADLTKLFLIHLATVGVNQENADILDNAIGGLHQLKDLNTEDLFTRFSYTERVFLKDPAGQYAHMDLETKAFYREQCAIQAAQNNSTEEHYADKILSLARCEKSHENHIGFPLIARSKETIRRRNRGKRMLFTQLLFPLAAGVIASVLLHVWWFWLVSYPVFYRLLQQPLCRQFTKNLAPHFMPRMELAQMVPETHRTLVTISILMPSEGRAKSVADHLEQQYLANHNGAIDFCLLVDFPEHTQKHREGDQEQVDALVGEIHRLNQKHGDRFILAIRPRTYSKTQDAYCGWERKRGALLQLSEAIITHNTDAFYRLIDPSNHLTKTQYLLALDQDSVLPFDCAYDLITAAAHPLNRPVLSKDRKTVVSGYGILTPQIANQTQSISTTTFAKIHSPRGGVSAYHAFCSSPYQDLFDQTVFTGKGLIHVHTYYTCMNHAVPPERLLSHDIIEGAFLRCGLVSDTEIADSNPDNVLGWDKRQHRWIRGDFQNILWLSPAIKSETENFSNSFGYLPRFMITDNLMRALFPIFALVTLFTCLLVPRIVPFGIILIAAACLWQGTKGLILGVFKNGWSAFNQQYYSRLLPIAITAFTQELFSFSCLAKDAFITLDGAMKGIYRQFISGKHCMEWATAQQVSFENKNGIAAYLFHNIPSLILGCFLLLTSHFFGNLIGLIWLISPIIQWQTAKPIRQKSSISLNEKEQAYLREEGRKIWQYYADFATKEHNYLPPDNVQEQPIFAIAHRTSPTNIGLYMASTVCANDLGYINEQEMVERLEQTMETVKHLERYQGHLLNWYDTKTCQPLFPRYCSTVDSGNFACFLTLVKNRLKTVGSTRAKQLSLCMEQELEAMDFRVFYNSHRKLFHIGYDLENQTLSNSFYDMLMSEFRMTGYYAIAKRQIPKNHWYALGRTLTRSGRHVGPMSWTGTAFEYLMPPLILPTYENTLFYEATNFCVECQKNFSRSGHPWGCSESGYYEFDEQFNYQYKPNGIPTLALKCTDPKEYIVSPYSTFLALPFSSKSGIKNLRLLERLGAKGKYGFYEAVDYTRNRTGNEPYKIIKSYMAHHLGMSLCAIENTLKENRLHKWFMQDEMAGADALLKEIIPGGSSVYQHYVERQIPQRQRFSLGTPTHSLVPDVNHVNYGIFAGEKRSCFIGSTGQIESKWIDVLLYGTPKDMLENRNGLIMQLTANGTVHPLTLAPHYQNKSAYSFEVQKKQVIHTYNSDEFSVTIKTTLSKNLLSECRTITMKNRTNRPQKCALTVYFEPYLHTVEEMRSHPAFYKLFIATDYDSKTNRITFRSRKHPVALTAGFVEQDTITTQCNARTAMESHANRFWLKKDTTDTNSIPDPCCCMTLHFTLHAKSSAEKHFVMAMGETPNASLRSFETALTCETSDLAMMNRTPQDKLAHALFPYILSSANQKARPFRANNYHRGDLWRVGISGDVPILLCAVRNSRDTEQLQCLLETWHRLSTNHISTDFAILYKESGDYSRQRHSDIITVIHNCGLSSKIGKKGGIHLINTALFDKTVKTALLCSAAYVFTGRLSLPLPESEWNPILLHCASPNPPAWEVTAKEYGGYFSNDRFVITQKPQTPWSHILANEKFGTQVTDRCLGFTYAYNARENRLTPWSNNAVTHHIGERLILQKDGLYYDMIDGATAVFSPACAEYYGRIDALTYRVRVTVQKMQKRIDIDFDSPFANQGKIACFTLPSLDFDRKHSRQILADTQCDIPVVHQPFNTAFGGYMALQCTAKSCYCTDSTDFWSGQWNHSLTLPNGHSCLACIADQSQHLSFTLSYGDTPIQAVENGDFSVSETPLPCNQWQIHSPDPKLDVMVNHFLPHQVLASRLFARTGFYQCSGAFGFRDQLQDAGNLLYRYPDLTKQQILRCCSRQFREGDVLHWWHELPNGPSGVRTRCSDDMLWLPLTVARYVTATNDLALLSQTVPYLKAPLLRQDEQERYLSHLEKGESETVYMHCKRAIDVVSFSERSLAKIGSCDWNDGFSSVGIHGKGESVWLTQFYAMVCEDFAPIARVYGEQDYAAHLINNAKEKKQAVETHCWDDDRYTRAYFDDGRVIGSSASEENQLDVLPQAFSVLANLPNNQQNSKAVLTAYETLVDHQHRLIRLFTPPFCRIQAGYISDYPKGIRENGGQYTHGVIWLIAALFRMGEIEKAYTLLQYVNPATHCEREETAKIYGGEPYAVAGDIYTNPRVCGMSGWTHYTGAAGWLYRIIWEEMLGIRIQGDRILVNPHLPQELYNTRCTLEFKGTTAEFVFRLHGTLTKPKEFPLDGKHHQWIIGRNSV